MKAVAPLIVNNANAFEVNNGRLGISGQRYDLAFMRVGQYGIGGFTSASSTFGIITNPVNNGTGSVYGLAVTPETTATGVPDLFGVSVAAKLTGATSSAVNARAFQVSSPTLTAGAALTSAFGLDINAQKVTGVGTGYGVWQRGASDINYFAGNTGIGTTPNHRLDVNESGASHTSGVGTYALCVNYTWTGSTNVSGTYVRAANVTLWTNQAAGTTFTGGLPYDIMGFHAETQVRGGGNYAAQANGLVGIVVKDGAGTLSAGAALLARSPGVASPGTMTRAVGLDIDTQKVTGVTNGYGIYQRGASDLNYFAGNVGIGQQPSATVPLTFADAVGDKVTYYAGYKHGIAPATLYADVSGGGRHELRIAGVVKLTVDVNSTTSAVIVRSPSGFAHGDSTKPSYTSGAGTPENVVTAPVGSTFARTDGAKRTAFYRKVAGVGASGWLDEQQAYVNPSAPATVAVGDLWYDTDEPSQVFGTELFYSEITTNVSVPVNTEATAQTVITSGARTYDGTPIWLEFFSARTETAAGGQILLLLWDGTTNLGWWSQVIGANFAPVCLRRRLTPTAGTHTYRVAAWTLGVTGTVWAGTGTSGLHVPAYLRITQG